MKKFRLVKEYPGSPKLSSVFEYWTDNISEQIYDGKTFIALKIVKDYPEFWEEVVEKEYEILSFKEISEKWICRLLKNGRYAIVDFLDYPGGVTLNQMEGMSDRYVINSVKRLSDGEVFTLGDLIEGYKNTGIKAINIYSYGLEIITDANGDGCIAKKLSWQLHNIKKSKQKLFTTEDKVDVFEGDGDLFSVLIKGSWDTKTTKVDKFLPETRNDTWLHFKTKESYEEYIIMNKPCLSLNDIKDVIAGRCFIGTEFVEGRLREIITNKVGL